MPDLRDPITGPGKDRYGNPVDGDTGTQRRPGLLNKPIRDLRASRDIRDIDIAALEALFAYSRRTVARWMAPFGTQSRLLVPQSWKGQIPVELNDRDFTRWLLGAGLSFDGITREPLDDGTDATFDLKLRKANLAQALVRVLDMVQGVGGNPHDPRNSGYYLAQSWHRIIIVPVRDGWNVLVEYRSNSLSAMYERRLVKLEADPEWDQDEEFESGEWYEE